MSFFSQADSVHVEGQMFHWEGVWVGLCVEMASVSWQSHHSSNTSLCLHWFRSDSLLKDDAVLFVNAQAIVSSSESEFPL